MKIRHCVSLLPSQAASRLGRRIPQQRNVVGEHLDHEGAVELREQFGHQSVVDLHSTDRKVRITTSAHIVDVEVLTEGDGVPPGGDVTVALDGRFDGVSNCDATRTVSYHVASGLPEPPSYSGPGSNVEVMTYRVTFAKPHDLTDGDGRTLTVTDYEDVGSMCILELPDGRTRSVGKQLIESVTAAESEE